MRKLILAGVLLWGAAPAEADMISDWIEGADSVAFADIGTTPGQPNFTRINSSVVSQVALAMFEAANAADRRYQSYLGVPASKGRASPEAAAAAAAHAVMIAAFPSKKDGFDEALALHLAQVADGPAKEAGIALGQTVAKAVLARPVFDDKASIPAYKPYTSPGRFVGTTIPTLADFSYAYQPWFINRVDAISPPAPPAVTSARYARDYEEVRRMGSKTSTERKPADTANAKFWMEANYPWIAMRAIAARKGRSLVQNARFYALMSLASDDTGFAHSVAKLNLMSWRPITAIRNGDDDGNDGTQVDPKWEPLLRTPNQPEYPCGHCIYAATTAAILESEVGPSAPEGMFRNDKMPGAGTTVKSWTDYVRAVNESRIQAGAHFRFSTEAGTDMGYQVARTAIAKFAPPLEGRSRR